jgi:hypothetical protein
MKIQWHWGTGIVVALSLFILLILGFVFKMYFVEFHLVEEDYYPKELNYQQHIKKEQNAKALSAKVQLKQIDKTIEVQFPQIFDDKKIEGTILFYYITNEKYDKNFTIQTDTSNTFYFPITQFVKGRYKVKIEYRVDTTSYYQEESIILN